MNKYKIFQQGKMLSLVRVIFCFASMWLMTSTLQAQYIRVVYANDVANAGNTSTGTVGPSEKAAHFIYPDNTISISNAYAVGGGGGGGAVTGAGHGGGGGGGGYAYNITWNRADQVPNSYIIARLGAGGQRGDSGNQAGNAYPGGETILELMANNNGGSRGSIFAYGGGAACGRGQSSNCGGHGGSGGGTWTASASSSTSVITVNGATGDSAGAFSGGRGGYSGYNSGNWSPTSTTIGRNGYNPGNGGSGGVNLLTGNEPGGNGSGGRVGFDCILAKTDIRVLNSPYCPGNPATIELINKPNRDILFSLQKLLSNGTWITIDTLRQSNNWTYGDATVNANGAITSYRVQSVHTYNYLMSGSLNPTPYVAPTVTGTGVTNSAVSVNTSARTVTVTSNTVTVSLASGCPAVCSGGTVLFHEGFEEAGNPNACVSKYNWSNDRSAVYTAHTSGYADNAAWVNFQNHTPEQSPGCLLFVNIDGGADDQQDFFTTVMDGLCEAAKLKISFAVGNLMGSEGNNTSVQPRLVVKVLATGTNTVVHTYRTGYIPTSGAVPNAAGTWVSHAFMVDLTQAATILGYTPTSLTLQISNEETRGNGNDLVFDDFMVEMCGNTPAIRGASDVARCGTNTFTADYVNDGIFGTTLTSYWEYSTVNSPNDPSTWSEVPGTRATQTISIGATLTSDLIASQEGYYRLVVSSPANINSVRCRAMSNGVRFSPLNPAIEVKCLESAVQTCESEYFLRATYADDGLLGNNLCYVWEYLAPGNTQDQWTAIESTRDCVTNGFIVTSYMANVTGYYRLLVISNSIGCAVPSAEVYLIFYDSPSFDLNNPPVADCGQTVDITAAAVVIPPINHTVTFTYWRDANATSELTSEQAAAIGYSGVYFVKATNPRGCSTIRPVQVTIQPCITDDDVTLAVNQQARMTFSGGPFIPSTIGPGTIDGRACYNVTSSEISGQQSYRFTAITDDVRNVSYHILDPNGFVDTSITRLHGSLVSGPLPNGSSVAMNIWFRDDLPASVDGVVTLYIVYNNGTESVRVEKEITLQGTDCVSEPPIPECRPLEVVITQRELSNGIECRASVGGGANNTFEWYVDGVKQVGATSNVFILTRDREPGAYVVQAIVLSGCEECDIEIARTFAIIQPDPAATSTSVKVTYGTAASTAGGSFTKPVDFPTIDVRVWGGGAGGGRAVAWGRSSIFLNRDGVAAGGGGGGGGFARGTIPASYSGLVSATVGARTTGVAASGGNDRQSASAASASRVTWGAASVVGNGGAGGYSSIGSYSVDNGVSGGIGGTASSTGTTCIGCQGGTRGGNGAAVDPGVREWARGGSGGGSINGGSTVSGPTHTITYWTEAHSRQGNNGSFPGGGGSGAIALKVQGIFTSVRAKGGDGANGMVTMDFTYSKPTQPIISLNRSAVNVYEEPVTLRIEPQFYTPDNTAYQWYEASLAQPGNFTAILGATGQTLRVQSAGVYKVVAVRKGNTLPASINFSGAANVSFVNNTNNDGSSISGTTLNIGSARNAVESRTITFN